MVNKKHEEEEDQEDIEITNDTTEMDDPDLEGIEMTEKDVIKILRKKLKACGSEKRDLLEETQRTKAEFFNARKRLEEDKVRDRERAVIKHVERLLPLCDSFQMAMSDKEAWEKADENWRKGIEGIYSQLQSLLNVYAVNTINPIGEKFDPERHEALSTAPVSDKKDIDSIMQVIQTGYEVVKNDGEAELIRPARVIIGADEEN